MITIAVVLIFATLVEAVVEYATGPLEGTPMAIPSWAKQYVAIAVGIGVCFWYGVNLIAMVSDLLATQGVALPVPTFDSVGMVLTGIAISRGSNAVNDLMTLLRKKIDISYAEAHLKAVQIDETTERKRAVASGRENV